MVVTDGLGSNDFGNFIYLNRSLSLINSNFCTYLESLVNNSLYTVFSFGLSSNSHKFPPVRFLVLSFCDTSQFPSLKVPPLVVFTVYDGSSVLPISSFLFISCDLYHETSNRNESP